VDTVNRMNRVTDVVDVGYVDSLYKLPTAIIHDPYGGFDWILYVRGNEKQKEDFSDDETSIWDDYKSWSPSDEKGPAADLVDD
ncbi:hypothetical protein MKW92_019826, partial [Papaver armeniacum]